RVRHYFDKLAAWQKFSFLLNGAAVGRVPFGRSHFERIATVEREYRLHQALAKRSGADDQSAVVILQGTGYDLRGRRAPAIGEQNERNRRSDGIIGGNESLILAAAGADAGDLLAFSQEEIADAQ